VGESQQDGGRALVVSDDLVPYKIGVVWSEMLGLQAVGTEADFFELGGHSLAAVRMLAAVEEDVSVHVSFADFLECPTVGALAKAVARERRSPQDLPPTSARNDAWAARAA
jgi:acyl carrier protein